MRSTRPVLFFGSSFLGAAAVLAACTTRSPNGSLRSASNAPSATEQVCDLVCERAQVVPRPQEGPDFHVKATANANAVLESMQGDLLACYKTRIATNPQAHGFITADIVINSDGHVQSVETTGGAVLGPNTMSCIANRIKQAQFDRPHGGGTLRIHVPFSLRRVARGDETL